MRILKIKLIAENGSKFEARAYDPRKHCVTDFLPLGQLKSISEHITKKIKEREQKEVTNDNDN